MVMLAEYFALCYVRNNIKEKGATDILDFIHEIRKTDKFPNDGGYSGAIILEKYEVGNLAGNESDQYQDIYVNSLRDMIKVYQYIK